LFCTGNCFFEFSNEEHFPFRAILGDGSVDHVAGPGAQGRGEVLKEVLEFGGAQAGGDDEGELNDEAAEGDEGQEQVVRTGLDGLGGEAKLEGEVGGLFDEEGGEVFEVGRGEGVAEVAVLEGIEVAAGGTGRTGTEFGVAMGAALGVATHGPGAAGRDVAVGFVWVAGHGKSANGKSANRQIANH
jgi:hypothetical protein